MSLKIYTEIVNGKCPTCEELTMLIGLSREFYRCVSCGADLEQHVNGSIRYIPKIQNPKQISKYFEQIEDGQES
jgi:ribosomal protein S27E|tara:strand:+ start:430 stop:651 length:222 start_codon:yes stop_codon:yes gene_type:complete